MSFERNGVKVTERGWAGHFICADKCQFRRNTLLEYKDKKWIVSTVGAMPQPEALRKIPEFCSENGYDTIGFNRYYETMAFEAQPVKGVDGNIIYYDATVGKIIDFDSDWAIDHIDFTTDKLANEMHEQVLSELIEKIKEDK